MKAMNGIRLSLASGMVLLLAIPTIAGPLPPEARYCGVSSTSPKVGALGETGGIHITATGTLRVLIVFASFPDDTIPNPYWPPHGPPLFINGFIDPDTTTNTQASFNLTNYFRQMSLGQFHLVGDVLWVESAHSQEEYLNGSYGRANTDILKESVDPLVDFSRYDNWTNAGDYRNTNVPDGLVDMVIMVWRTNLFEFVGEASLGYKPGFVVDGKRIEMGFPDYLPSPVGSGVTCEYLYTDNPDKCLRTMAHEVGHWLLGGAHPYDNSTFSGKHQYWGILCAGQRISSCANTYERERLGWITVPEIQPGRDIPLSDYVSTGMAYKYHPVNGEPLEFFYIENHQKISVFDDVTVNPSDKGIWILHQEGPYMEMDNLRIKPSDGDWNWENPGITTACFFQGLPVFRRGVPMVQTGESHRDQIPTLTSLVNWMYVYQDPVGHAECGSFLAGQTFSGAFNASSDAVFSPYSNPSSDTWANQKTPFSLEVISEVNGVITVRYNVNSLDAAPARRYLGSDPTIQNTPPGWLSLAWGAQWAEGQSLEPDVNYSQLERQIESGGNWSIVYEGPAMSVQDGSITYDSSGAVPVLFRVRVRDTQGKYSAWSNVYYTRTSSTVHVETPRGGPEDVPLQYGLWANYPNPFNSSTTITFALAKRSRVRLSVCDILGREVRLLLDEPYGPGMQRLTWDGTNDSGVGVSSGIYILNFQTRPFDVDQVRSFSRVERMLLLR